MKFRNILLSLTAILIFAVVVFSQNPHDADESITKELHRNGVKYETKRAIVWAEKGSLTEQEAKDFAALANQGIIDIEKYTGVKFDKKHYQTDKIEYFLSPNAGISRAASINGKPYIYMRTSMIKNKTAPYLHEMTHVIVWQNKQSLWLLEGFPSLVETYVAAHYGGYSNNTFNPEHTPTDQLACSLLNTEIGKKILPLIGINGSPLTMNEEGKKISFIFSDRKVAAPAFYNLSESFVKFLVAKIGMKKMRKIFEATDTNAGILKITGRSTDEWKAAWLASLTK